MNRYGQDAVLTSSMDEFQHRLSCCGVNNFTDWERVGNGTVPPSCCRTPAPDCSARPGPDTVFDRGCLQSLEDWVRKHVLVVA
ncbi:CD63 antigen-like, partial [Malurus melanocephalus]|uniref:CD63 antigen-like n=1 Tax=Malurus melanocephalus TaxID=175006 RepID=UPI00254800A3